MAKSPPNLHTIDSRSACIQGVLKVKVKGHVIRALFYWHEHRFLRIIGIRGIIHYSRQVCNLLFFCTSIKFARWQHDCGRSLLSTIALFNLTIFALHTQGICVGVMEDPWGPGPRGRSMPRGQSPQKLVVFLITVCLC